MGLRKSAAEWYLIEYPDGLRERVSVVVEAGHMVIHGSGAEHEVPTACSVRDELELHWDAKIIESGIY